MIPLIVLDCKGFEEDWGEDIHVKVAVGDIDTLSVGSDTQPEITICCKSCKRQIFEVLK